jgi:uncharacterized membrane protein
MFTANSLGSRLTPFFAVVTLPLGILAFLFSGIELAAVVFVVGWLLLVPASAVLFGPSWSEEMDELAEFQEAAERLDEEGDAETADGTDPVDELRDRYARGEIDEAEFERRLEALLETDGVDATDDEAVERAVERLDEIQREDDGTDLERELE